MQKVAAYCRVSTDKDDQANSLESQKRYFAEYIGRNPLWELGEVYVDEGITGTSTRKRAAFNRMIADAQTHRFDLIITKEISRFARNTLDSIFYTRKLKALGIGVIFMNDNINTLDPDAELRLTIMSSIAQEESRKTSDRVKWGQKRRMEQGVVFGRDLLGYDVRNGRLYINEDGAKTVRLIFHKFVSEDKGSHVIARELREAGIPTAAYMKQWSGTTILRVLRNEKYCGDLVQKKTITPNYLNHEKKYNRGEEELVTLRDHHQPIISRELFNKAQQVLAHRSSSIEKRPYPSNDEARYADGKTMRTDERSKHSNRYCFSGKIKCGVCGRSYVSRTKKRRDGSIYKAWRCYESACRGRSKIDAAGNEIGCDNHAVNEDDLRLLMRTAVRSLPVGSEAFISHLSQLIETVLRTNPMAHWNCADSDSFRAVGGPDNLNGQIGLEKLEKPGRICEYPAGQLVKTKEELESRLRTANGKRRTLLELYLEKNISKEDYLGSKTKYETEVSELKLMLKKWNEKAPYIADGSESGAADALEQVSKTIRKLIQGDDWNDAFYRRILDRIVVWQDRTFEVSFQYLPQSRRYLITDEGNRK